MATVANGSHFHQRDYARVDEDPRRRHPERELLVVGLQPASLGRKVLRDDRRTHTRTQTASAGSPDHGAAGQLPIGYVSLHGVGYVVEAGVPTPFEWPQRTEHLACFSGQVDG